jgi:hypothetical protein
MWVVRRPVSDHFCHWPIDMFSLCQCAQSPSIARYSNLPSNSAVALGWGAKPRIMLALVHPALDHRLFSVIADLGHSFELMRAYISPSLPRCPTGHTVMTIYTVPLCPSINVTISLYIATIETPTKQQDCAMSYQNKYLLLKNGTALIHGEEEDVKAVRTDILVCGSTVSMVAPNIAPPPGSEVM